MPLSPQNASRSTSYTVASHGTWISRITEGFVRQPPAPVENAPPDGTGGRG
jgi:hypothetical protein